MTDKSSTVDKNKNKILYIEDNPLNAKLVQRVLGAEGYDVKVAENGLKGIDAAMTMQPDLILMDINLPDMSGREVTTRLRSVDAFKKIPIVALTAQTDEKQRAMTVAAGVDGYITKPFEVEELAQRVAFHLKGGKEEFTINREEAQQQYNQELVAHLERRLREAETANETLRRLDKIKSDFIQRVAHELRTPLTIIYGYSRLIQTADPIKEVVSDSPQFGAYIDGLVESIERMHSLVNEILTIYRIATGEIQPNIAATNLQTIVTDAVTSFSQAASQRKIELIYSKDDFPTAINVDRELMKMVFVNLIGNAIKYTPDGGKVTVSAEKTKEALKVQVKDTGIGIPKDDQERIFERFFSGSNTDTHSTSKTAFQGGGLGLGLSITKGIIKAHNGGIRVESTGMDEKNLPGSTFHIEIPLRSNYSELKPTGELVESKLPTTPSDQEKK